MGVEIVLYSRCKKTIVHDVNFDTIFRQAFAFCCKKEQIETFFWPKMIFLCKTDKIRNIFKLYKFMQLYARKESDGCSV